MEDTGDAKRGAAKGGGQQRGAAKGRTEVEYRGVDDGTEENGGKECKRMMDISRLTFTWFRLQATYEHRTPRGSDGAHSICLPFRCYYHWIFRYKARFQIA